MQRLFFSSKIENFIGKILTALIFWPKSLIIGIHNLCFESEIGKKCIPSISQFYCVKLGFKGYTFHGHVILMFEFQTDKQLFLQGSNSWLTNIRHLEKVLNKQELNSLSKGAFIQILQVYYKNKVETNLAHIKESSDSKFELFSTLYNNFSVPRYLNMNFSKAKRSLITKLRLSCHILNIETMRYCRPKIVRHERFCPFCPDTIESEGQQKSMIPYPKTIDLYQKLYMISAKE